MGKKAIVIDGQGGMIGRQICDLILQKMPDADLTAIGTNSTATANMLKGRVKRGASGENPSWYSAQTQTSSSDRSAYCLQTACWEKLHRTWPELSVRFIVKILIPSAAVEF